MEHSAATILAAAYTRLVILRHSNIKVVEKTVLRYPDTALLAGLCVCLCLCVCVCVCVCVRVSECVCTYAQITEEHL
jgi:hypothetical protein